MAHKDNDRIKISGYAQRIFFNNGIEYRDFSDELVGNQITSAGGVPLFTMGNFSVTTNLDPKPNRVFTQGNFSEFFTLDSISEEDDSVINIEKNIKTQLNLDLTNPLHYVWYGSFVEYNRVSLEDISDRWSAAIYVDNKVGSVTGDSVTNFTYDGIEDTSTFKVNSKYFFNPFKLKYTTDDALVVEQEEVNNLRNLIINHTSYRIEFSGRSYDIIDLTGSTQVTNSEVTVKTKGNAFVNLTDINGVVLDTAGSFQYFIKPKESKIEEFFSSLNEYQRNILNRDTYPIYKTTFSYPEETTEGVIVYKEQTINFPISKDGYNLNFFDGLYISYLDRLNEVAELFDKGQTNLMVRKYTAEIINSFDTAPRCDGDDLVNNGAKATNLLHIYGREFDEIKKYGNGIKYAHVVTYNKRDNLPDSLTKDLAHMLGFEQIDLLNKFNLIGTLLPSNGDGQFSGTSKNYTKKEIETEVYRRLILNIAWLWKSKGTRKAIEFLFRFMGAPESIVVFDEHVYVADKPIDVESVKRLLYLYTGDVDISKLPFDEDGYPLPPLNSDEMYFQKAGGWYRETGGDNAHIHTSIGNNPHAGPYDGGTEYIAQFESNCFIPGFSAVTEFNVTGNTLHENVFLNYNNGFVNGMPSVFDLYAIPLAATNNQLLNACVELNASVEECPPLSAGTTLFQDLCVEARTEYNDWTGDGGILSSDPYLVYSPEWYRIQRNFEIANQNYAQELVTENCDTNQCLSICADFVNTIKGDPCDNYNIVENGNFIYFTNEDGKKVLFDDFPNCCVTSGGIYKDFKDPRGRNACYCASSAPCNGTPVDMTEDGIIIFQMGDGNVFVDYNVGDSLTPSQAQSLLDTYDGNESFYDGYIGWTIRRETCSLSVIGSDIPSVCHIYLVNYENNQNEEIKIIKPEGTTTQNTTTQVSSPECCTWHNYDYTINIIDDKKVISCFNPNPNVVTNISIESTIRDIKGVLDKLYEELKSLQKQTKDEECESISQLLVIEQKTIENQIEVYEDKLKDAETKVTTPYLPETTAGYSEYTPYSNLNADIKEFESITIFDQSISESVYVKYTNTDLSGNVETDFGSSFNDSDLMDCTIWEPEVNNIGNVSFSVTDFEGDTTTIDWNTTIDDGANLYKECCIAKGYSFGSFKVDPVTDKRIPMTSDQIKSQQSTGLVEYCVDPDYIQCSDLEDIKIVLSSNQWNGFYLPEDVDGECDVEIMLDTMIRYDADKLLGCALENNCRFPYVNINSVYDPGCPNFVVFSDRDRLIKRLREVKTIEDVNQVSQDIIDYYPSLTDEVTNQFINYYDTNAIEVWQTPGLQIEPSQECCDMGYGGSMVGIKDIIRLGGENSKTTTSDINFDFLNIPAESPTLNFVERFNKGRKGFSDFIKSSSECVKFDEFDANGCDFDYSELFTTEKVCYISQPDECLIYGVLLRDYWKLLNQLYLIRDAVDICVEDYNDTIKDIKDIEAEVIKFGVKETEIKYDGVKNVKDEKLRSETMAENLSKLQLSKELLEKSVRVTKQDPKASISEKINAKKDEQIIAGLDVQISEQISKEGKGVEAYNGKKDEWIKDEQANTKCLKKLNEILKKKKEKLDGLGCCIELQVNVEEYTDELLKQRGEVVIGAISCNEKWEKELQERYNKYLSSKAENVISFMDETEICVTLEVDNSLGVKNNNRITKYTTLNSFTNDINPVWKWDPTSGGYDGIVLEGSEGNVNVVKQSVENALIDEGITPSPDMFEPDWKPIKFTINETECANLKKCYPGKQFFIGLTIKNYECDTCLLIDNVQINVDVNKVTRTFSPDACPSFDLQCVVDDKKSWVFTDGGVTETIDLRDVVNCVPLSNSRTITTYGNKDERLWTDLEYRYTEYDVNHSKLVVNSKESSFRIDPANAIECDVYGFWQEIDCDECDTLGECDAGSDLTWTGATGQSVTLTGVTCTDYDCSGLIKTLRGFGRRWVKDIYHKTGDMDFAKNASVSAMKYQNKASNVKHLNGDVRGGTYLPVNMGIGFDIQTNDCGTDIIEINRGNDEYSLISEELDGTLGFYSYTGETGPLCDFTPLVDAECCRRMSDIITTKSRYGFNMTDKDYTWDTTRNACVWAELPAITGNCDSDCSYYGESIAKSNVIIPGVNIAATSGTCLQEGIPADTDIYVFYDATSNSLANIRIQSAHIYRWYKHYIKGGVLVDLTETGGVYTGKLRQYAVVGKSEYPSTSSDGGATESSGRNPQGERWLAWASYPWTGRFLSTDDGDDIKNHGLIFQLEHNGKNGYASSASSGETAKQDWAANYNQVSIWNDETTSSPSEVIVSVVDILYDKTADGRYKDPITGEIFNATTPTQAKALNGSTINSIMITEIPGIHREDIGEGGVAPELLDYMDGEGFFSSLSTNYQLTDTNEFNRDSVFMISMIDESARMYHPTYTTGTKQMTGDPSHDFYLSGSANATSGFTATYVADFNKFMNNYQNNYLYFRGFNYAIMGGLKSDFPSATNLRGMRASFALHSYAAIEGETVNINDLKEYPYSGTDGGTMSAITISNPYSALTATTLTGGTESGLKHFGWGENHQVGLGSNLTNSQVPIDLNTLVESTPVPAICVTAATVTSASISAVCADTNICVKPLEYLETDPNNVNVKVKFDEMVIANLIDAKSRQVLSGYPMMQLFYHLYLTANRCGRTLTNRLGTDDMFEMMDLVGDYWTDIIEQVVPATTIWDGCKNSGKVYRNTIFDQPKFPYKRTVLNYYDSECPTDQISNEIIASEVGLSIEVIETCISGSCGNEEIQSCQAEETGLINRKIFLEGKIPELTATITTSTLYESSDQVDSIGDDVCLYTQEQKDEFTSQRDNYQTELIELNIKIGKVSDKCDNLIAQLEIDKLKSAELKSSCSSISDRLITAENKLTEYAEGTVTYEKQRDFIALLRGKYTDCIKKSNLEISTYNTIFITQMYDSNEYEGNVRVFGDPDWEKEVQLIHSCDEVSS